MFDLYLLFSSILLSVARTCLVCVCYSIASYCLQPERVWFVFVIQQHLIVCSQNAFGLCLLFNSILLSVAKTCLVLCLFFSSILLSVARTCLVCVLLVNSILLSVSRMCLVWGSSKTFAVLRVSCQDYFQF